VRRQKRKLTLSSSVGAVQIETDYGQVAGGGSWLCPQRAVWGIGPHQKLTPALQDRLCLTVTLTGAYGSAAQLAAKWGCGVEDSTLHQLVKRIGGRAQAQAAQRLKRRAVEEHPQRAPSRLGVLLADGWLVRHRGGGWGRKKTQQKRVEWHEMKMGVYYQVEQAAERRARRAELVEIVGRGQWRCWIFITAASMCGPWAGRSKARSRPKGGWNRCCIKCGMGERKEPCGRLPDYRFRGESGANGCVRSKTTLPDRSIA
jgi:hypothetical protein